MSDNLTSRAHGTTGVMIALGVTCVAVTLVAALLLTALPAG
jgi:hypothetical protein